MIYLIEIQQLAWVILGISLSAVFILCWIVAGVLDMKDAEKQKYDKANEDNRV